jgi:hypothetical protein
MKKDRSYQILNEIPFDYQSGDQVEVYNEKEILSDTGFTLYNDNYIAFLQSQNYRFILKKKIQDGWETSLFTATKRITINDYQIKRLISRGIFKPEEVFDVKFKVNDFVTVIPLVHKSNQDDRGRITQIDYTNEKAHVSSMNMPFGGSINNWFLFSELKK